jgi:hypothetical protein
MPERPSFSVSRPYGGDTEVTDPSGDFSSCLGDAGVRSFHKATIFLTDASGDLGDVCGRRRPLFGVTDVRVSVSDS